MKIVTNTPETLVIEARHGFLLFVALIAGLLLVKSGLSTFAADPGVLTGLWLAALSVLAVAMLWVLSERLTVTLGPEDLRIKTRRFGPAKEDSWPLEDLTGARALPGKRRKTVLELTLRDAAGSETLLRPGSTPRTPGADEAAVAINSWLDVRRGTP